MARIGLPGIAGALALVMACGAGRGRRGAAWTACCCAAAARPSPHPCSSRGSPSSRKVQPGLQVEYDSIGSGEGISRFVTGSLDFGGTDAPLSEAQMRAGRGRRAAAADRRRHDRHLLQPARASRASCACRATSMPASSTARSPSGTTSGLQAANPGPRPAQAHHRRGHAPRRQRHHLRLRQSSPGDRPDWREQKRGVATRVDWPGGAMTARGNEGVAATILNSEYSIGYVEYGFAKRLGLSMAVLAEQGRRVRRARPGRRAGGACQRAGRRATTSSCAWSAIPAGAESYPVVTLTWAMVNQHYADPQKAAAVRAFLGWGLGDGQAVARAAGLCPPRRRPHGGEPGVARHGAVGDGGNRRGRLRPAAAAGRRGPGHRAFWSRRSWAPGSWRPSSPAGTRRWRCCATRCRPGRSWSC